MQFIRSKNKKFVKQFIESTFFGALKFHHSEMDPASILVGTIFVDKGEWLWCFCEESLPVLFDAAALPVSLKYISREKDIFMKITGIASVVQPEKPAVQEDKDPVDAKKYGLSLIKIKMEETVYYTRQNGQIRFYGMTG